jgi:hypothetical protein
MGKVEQVLKYRNRSRVGFYNAVSLLDFVDENEFYENVEFPEELIQKTEAEIKEENPEMSDDELRDEAISRLEESLAYWTIYFEPEWENVKIALECRLIPFRFKEHFFLALGACGMDLSPKLDAYQVLTSGAIDEFSILFTDEKYFRYVVGDEVTEKVKRVLGLVGGP